MSDTLVLGIGNVYLSDEAIGVRVIEALEERFNLPPEVEVMEGGTCGYEMAGGIANKKHLIVVDAVSSQGNPPGTIIVLKDDEVPTVFARRISPHQIGLTDVLSTLKLTDDSPERITLIGVVPEDLSYTMNMSETMHKVFDAVLERTVSVLRADGFSVTPKAA